MCGEHIQRRSRNVTARWCSKNCGWHEMPMPFGGWGPRITYGLTNIDPVCPDCGAPKVPVTGQYEFTYRLGWFGRKTLIHTTFVPQVPA